MRVPLVLAALFVLLPEAHAQGSSHEGPCMADSVVTRISTVQYPLTVSPSPARIAGVYRGDFMDRHGGGNLVRLDVDGTYVNEQSLCGYGGSCGASGVRGRWTLRGLYVYVIATARFEEERYWEEAVSQEATAIEDAQPERFLLYEFQGHYGLWPTCPGIESHYIGPEAHTR